MFQERERMKDLEIEIAPIPLTHFGFQYSTGKILTPNYEDLYRGSHDTVNERLTNDTKPTCENLTHEFLHAWIFEEIGDKKTSLDLDNIDKGYGKDGEFYVLSAIEG